MHRKILPQASFLALLMTAIVMLGCPQPSDPLEAPGPYDVYTEPATIPNPARWLSKERCPSLTIGQED